MLESQFEPPHSGSLAASVFCNDFWRLPRLPARLQTRALATVESLVEENCSWEVSESLLKIAAFEGKTAKLSKHVAQNGKGGKGMYRSIGALSFAEPCGSPSTTLG